MKAFMIRLLYRILKRRPNTQYSETEKRIIAYSVAWEGSITLSLRKKEKRLRAKVAVYNTELDLISNFHEVVKIGRVGTQKLSIGKRKTKYHWYVDTLKEVKFILEQILLYMPSERKRKIGILALEFCNSRINLCETSHDNLPYMKREFEIYHEIKKLNKRGVDDR